MEDKDTSSPREDDRNEELPESPVPDPEEPASPDDVPEAD